MDASTSISSRLRARTRCRSVDSLDVGDAGESPAVYLQALDLDVERLEQRYHRVDDDTTRRRFHYSAPRFDYDDYLVYDSHGLVLHYPGIATRIL